MTYNVPMDNDFPLELTQAAIERLDDLMEVGQTLRVSLRGGGCAGMEYQFDLEDGAAEEGDYEKTFQGHVKVRVDPISANYLRRATLDFEDHPFNSRFVMKNPNATTTCGCGSSFVA